MNMMIILAGLVILGAASQWLAWRIKLPAIIFLLGIGIIAGPVTDLIQPDTLFGPLLFPGISLAVAVILFEGALNLRLRELGGLGPVIRRMVSLGTISSWLILAVATHWITGFEWPVAILFGAVVVVSGPTVIGPILRAARPNVRITNVLMWESILIDPIGALLAVLVFEAVVAHHGSSGLSSAALVFLRIIGVGLLLGILGGQCFGWLLRNRAIPDYLHGVVALGSVFIIFATANQLAPESGLLAVTLMGVWIANMRAVPLENVLNFKESLSILLISILFILLAARLNLAALGDVIVSGILLMLVIQFIAQPIKVLLAYDSKELNWRERLMTAWIAPRGIVAAAGAPVYAAQLQDLGYKNASLFVPLTFALIIVTVLLASFTARPLAQLLGVSEKDPRGILIIGANNFAIAVSKKLKDWGYRPLLIDDEYRQIQAARMAGLETFLGSPVSEAADRQLNLIGFGYLLALSTDPARNLIASLRYNPEFGHRAVFTLSDGSGNKSSPRNRTARQHRRHHLFNDQATADALLSKMENGWTLKTTKLTEQFDWAQYGQQFINGYIPLFMLTNEEKLEIINSDMDEIKAQPGDQILSLIAPETESPTTENATPGFLP
ncbi:MAG: sodium:proton antiporter [Acidithiobacillus sp.]